MKNGYEYDKTCLNKCLISEDSLSRTLNVMEDDEFAVITAFKKGLTKSENIQRNQILRGLLNDKNIGVYQLVCQRNEGTIEKCYLTKKPDII